MTDIDPKQAWDDALNSSYLFADIVLESDEGQGLSRLAGMDIGQIRNLVGDLMREGQTEPDVLRHTIESLLVLLKDSEERSSRDALTKIHNRRHLGEMVDIHTERMSRDETTNGAMVVIDLDGFKPINDIYGHAAGDAALVKAAATLSAAVRTADIPARIGGDEFAVLLIDADANQAQDMTQRLRTTFSQLNFEWEGRQLPIRASVGVAMIEKGQDTQTVFKNADAAMYVEKQNKASTRDPMTASGVYAPSAFR